MDTAKLLLAVVLMFGGIALFYFFRVSNPAQGIGSAVDDYRCRRGGCVTNSTVPDVGYGSSPPRRETRCEKSLLAESPGDCQTT